VKTKPIITLLTDFGLDDEYVAVMKAVILSVHREVDIIDITHAIVPHDIRQAALLLNSAYPYFPQGSIHVAVVDPGVGGKREILCLKHQGHYFIAPNNGILTFVVQSGPPDKVYAVTNRTFFLHPVSHTFHGRDIFAPLAAQLAKGTDISATGEIRTYQDVYLLDLPPAYLSSEGHLIGEIVSIDRFGNIITNIDRPKFCKVFTDVERPSIVVSLAGHYIDAISTSYDGVADGKPLAIFGSRNCLEISVNRGNAKAFFNAHPGQHVAIMRKTSKLPERNR
jgi:hypothetical protein